MSAKLICLSSRRNKEFKRRLATLVQYGAHERAMLRKQRQDLDPNTNENQKWSTELRQSHLKGSILGS
jgi:hypothetical protein